jgi:hypothetical protein
MKLIVLHLVVWDQPTTSPCFAFDSHRGRPRSASHLLPHGRSDSLHVLRSDPDNPYNEWHIMSNMSPLLDRVQRKPFVFDYSGFLFLPLALLVLLSLPFLNSLGYTVLEFIVIHLLASATMPSSLRDDGAQDHEMEPSAIRSNRGRMLSNPAVCSISS